MSLTRATARSVAAALFATALLLPSPVSALSERQAGTAQSDASAPEPASVSPTLADRLLNRAAFESARRCAEKQSWVNPTCIYQAHLAVVGLTLPALRPITGWVQSATGY